MEIDGAFHYSLSAKQDSFFYAPPKVALERHAGCCRAEKKLEEVFTAMDLLDQQFGLAIDLGKNAFINMLPVSANECGTCTMRVPRKTTSISFSLCPLL